MSTLADKWEELAQQWRKKEEAIKQGIILDCAFSPYEMVLLPDEVQLIAEALRAVEKGSPLR